MSALEDEVLGRVDELLFLLRISAPQEEHHVLAYGTHFQ